MLLTLLSNRGYNLVYDMENKPQDYVVCVPAWDTGRMSTYLVYRAAKEDISQNNVWLMRLEECWMKEVLLGNDLRVNGY